MKIKIFLISFLLMNICHCSVKTSKLSFSESMKLIENFRYVKDKKTNLCFAIVAFKEPGNMSTSGLAMANVPCTTEVEDLIKR